MCPVTFTALAVSAGMTAGTAAVVGTAVSGMMIGMAANTAMNLATGQSAFAGTGKAALFGAIGGGISGGINPGAYLGGGAYGQLGTFSHAITTASPILSAMAPTAMTLALGGAAGSVLRSMTPDPAQFGYGAQAYTPQGYSSQHAQVTGSGGRQAAGVLAEEMKKARTLRQRQQEETTAYNVAGELASTGLQIA